jgi:hypothetical protein
VANHDEEADEPIHPGLPDPSTRHWRHPSEVGRMQATPPPSPIAESSSPIWPLTGVLGGFTLLAALGFFSLGIGGTSVETTGLPEAPSDWPSSAVLNSGRGLGVPSATTAPLPTSTTRPPTTESGRSTSTAAETFPTMAATMTTMTTVTPWTASTHRVDNAAALATAHGELVVTLGSGPSALALAPATPVEGMIVTTTRILGGNAELYLSDGASWLPLEIAGVDESTGLAVLGLADQARIPEPQSVAPVELGGQEGTMVRVPPLTAFQNPTGAAEGSEGVVYSRKLPVRLANGRAVFEPIQTTIQVTSELPGGPLLDDEGQLVGVVLDTPMSNLTALPVRRVRQLAASFAPDGARTWWTDQSIVTDPAGQGLLVVTVPPDSKHHDEQQGLQVGDRIVAVGERLLVSDPKAVDDDRSAPGATEDAPLDDGSAHVVERDRRDVVLHLLRLSEQGHTVIVDVEREGIPTRLVLGSTD